MQNWMIAQDIPKRRNCDFHSCDFRNLDRYSAEDYNRNETVRITPQHTVR